MATEKQKKTTTVMGKYEIGKFVGQGNFAKVYHGRNLDSGQTVAVKVIDKEKVTKAGLMNQIKREISVMRLVKHPFVVELYEVMASKTKIYFVMEYVGGGELFNRVVKGRLKEDVARKYFQQLVAAVDFCHSRGVYHRDLKPENLIISDEGNLKVSDFGLSALADSRRQDGLLHTTCGTPSYVAPEVISKQGYDGAKADIWSCGVILFVLLAGYLPFHDQNLAEMYRKISKGEFKCPQWFPPEIKKLLSRILDPNPETRITVSEIMENPWFIKGFDQIEAQLPNEDQSSPQSVLYFSAFEGNLEGKEEAEGDLKPRCLNAFGIISLSPGFGLSGLCETGKCQKPPEVWFTPRKSASAVTSTSTPRYWRWRPEVHMMEVKKIAAGSTTLNVATGIEAVAQGRGMSMAGQQNS